MGQLDRNSDLYKSYVKKFSAQEDAVEKMRGRDPEADRRRSQQRKSLDDYLLSLNI